MSKRLEMYGAPLTFMAIWAAVVGATGVLPAIPILGFGFTISVGTLVAPMGGLFFGSIAGMIATGIGGLIYTTIAPYTAIFGIITFLCPMTASLTSGLYLEKRWYACMVIYAAIWLGWLFVYPEVDMQAWWYPVAVFIPSIVLTLPPINSFIADKVLSWDAKWMVIGCIVASWCGAWNQLMLGNTMCQVMYRLPYAVWPASLAMSYVGRPISAVISGIFGVGILRALRKLGISFGPILRIPKKEK